jgi:hypothetical protein
MNHGESSACSRKAYQIDLPLPQLSREFSIVLLTWAAAMTADQRLYSTIPSPFKTGRRLDVADDKRYLGVRDAPILYRIIDRQHVRAAAEIRIPRRFTLGWFQRA